MPWPMPRRRAPAHHHRDAPAPHHSAPAGPDTPHHNVPNRIENPLVAGAMPRRRDVIGVAPRHPLAAGPAEGVPEVAD